MQKNKRKSIAMVGMYGGMWREYNPGCFMVGLKTKLELQKRFPVAVVDMFSIDNKGNYDGVVQEEVCGNTLHFFTRHQQIKVLNEVLSNYDVLIFGGDIIWGGDDVIADNDIFFLRSPEFLKKKNPLVLFNSVHTFYDDINIVRHKEKFVTAIELSIYTSVRTVPVQRRLKKFGLDNITFVPDPVLDLDMNIFTKANPVLPLVRDKKVLGISIREKLADDLITSLKDISLDDFEVVLFPFSKQYNNLETVMKVKAEFGNKFTYITEYFDPIKSYQFIDELDLFLNDTFHGVIASIIYQKPFISLDVEEELTSRKQQLLETMSIDSAYNIRLAYSDLNNSKKLIDTLPQLMQEPLTYNPETVQQVKAKIRVHYDCMEEIIRRI